MNAWNPSLPVAGTATAPQARLYGLPVAASDARVSLARGWLWLGLQSLLLAGVFSVLLVLARTPALNRFVPSGDFFRVALVVHVDLSVLVWFVSCAGLLWSLNGQARLLGLGRAALAVCTAGSVAMALAPWSGPGVPVMSNYIPVLDNAAFLGGLLVFGAGSALLVLRGLLTARAVGVAPGASDALRFGLNASVIAAGVALLAFAWSWLAVPRTLDGKAYYEIVFWGGGHALQFAWTLLMLVAWLWLAGATGAPVMLSPRLVLALFLLALASVFLTPYAYLAHDVASVEHRHLLTWGMRLGGGVSIVPVGLAVALALRGHRASEAQRPVRAALVASMLLFAAGGLIGVVIQGSNVRIPAHYHGCIVGVTLALMGLVFHLLPRLGFGTPAGRMAAWQPLVYGAGQLMHIAGLVWSGGYGVQRKVAGAEQVLHGPGEVAGMALMGLGGAVAIVGGLMFVAVVLRAVLARRAEARP